MPSPVYPKESVAREKSLSQVSYSYVKDGLRFKADMQAIRRVSAPETGARVLRADAIQFRHKAPSRHPPTTLWNITDSSCETSIRGDIALKLGQSTGKYNEGYGYIRYLQRSRARNGGDRPRHVFSVRSRQGSAAADGAFRHQRGRSCRDSRESDVAPSHRFGTPGRFHDNFIL
jgi:hypothetical protein